MAEVEDDTFRLTPSNGRTAILFAAMLVWFGIGAYRFASVGGILWLALTLVGLVGAVVYGLMLLPGSSYLQASPDGLTVSTAFRKRDYSWAQIRSIYVEKILNKRVVRVQLRLRDEGLHPDDHTKPNEQNTVVEKVRDETLPDTYGMTPEALVDRLTAYKRRYG